MEVPLVCLSNNSLEHESHAIILGSMECVAATSSLSFIHFLPRDEALPVFMTLSLLLKGETEASGLQGARGC